MQFSKAQKAFLALLPDVLTRNIFFIVLVLVSSLLPWAYATQELKGDSISVVYDNPETFEFAQEVAQKSSEARTVLVDLFNFEPRHITVVIEDSTDSYNAFAITNPHLKVSLRPLFPSESELGFRTEDTLYALMLHEFVHTMQLTYTATEPSVDRIVASERSLFSAGEVASVPPAWFIEGIATWVESTYGGGGRLNDAFTNGIIQSLALEDALPSLEDVSLTSFAQWPYGRARYLFGASFIDYLVNKYGFQTIIDTLHIYNQGGLIGGFLNDFSTAWFTVTDVTLDEEWLNWQKSVRAKTMIRVFDKPDNFTEVMSTFASPTLSPDGKYLAWVDVAQGIMVAEISKVEEVDEQSSISEESLIEEATAAVESNTVELNTVELNTVELNTIELSNVQVVLAGKSARKIDWYSDHQLLYSRTVRDSLTSFQKVFLLNIDTGIETLFSSQARLKGATANLETGCVFALRDVRPEPSLLVELCPTSSDESDSSLAKAIWQAPKGMHFLNTDISPDGKILVSLWDAGKADIAYFDTSTGELSLIIQDAAQDLDPSWRVKESGEASIVFRSDRHSTGSRTGVFEVYELEPRRSTQQKHRVTRLSRTPGGAFQPIHFDDETLIYSALGKAGFQLATLPTKSPNPIGFVSSPEVSYILKKVTSFEAVTTDLEHTTSTVPDGFELQEYQPLLSMLPYAVSPAFSIGNVDLNNLADIDYLLGATVFAEDITGKHSYSVSGGINNILKGHLEGQYIIGSYTYSPTNVLTPVSQSPIDMGLSVGVWPHFPFAQGAVETALGGRAFVNLKLPTDTFVNYANLSVGLVNIQSRPSDWFLDASARFMISKQRRDTWDYVTGGQRSAIFAVVSPSGEGLSGGVWGTTSYHDNLSNLGLLNFGLSGIGEVYFQAGYRPRQPIPITMNSDFNALAHIGFRHTINTAWRYGDGLHAIERVSIKPRLSTWYDTELHVGADIGLYFDSVVNYLAPISVGAQVGYADGFWYSWGLGLPNF